MILYTVNCKYTNKQNNFKMYILNILQDLYDHMLILF